MNPEASCSTMAASRRSHMFSHLPDIAPAVGIPYSVRDGYRIVQHDEFPRGREGVDTLVRAMVTKRRYEEIIGICGPDFKKEVEEIIATAHMMLASMKIPEASFDKVLRMDTYVISDITLYLYEPFSPPDEAVVGEVRPIFLNQMDQAFYFYGTAAVFNKLKAWKWACEELNRRVRNQDTLTGAAWSSAGAAARPIDFQGSGRDMGKYPGASFFQEISHGGVRVLLPTDMTVTEMDNSTFQIEYQDGRYERDFKQGRSIGTGGFGIVVEARNKMDKCMYAVKRVLENPEEDVLMKTMLREIEVLASLSHPNIVGYKQAWVEKLTTSLSRELDSLCSATTPEDEHATDAASCSTRDETIEEKVSESQGITPVLHIQMELCGRNLFKALESWNTQSDSLCNTDTWRKAVLIILTQLLEAFQYIHSKGIIHRDVKPGNIFFVRSEGLEPENILNFHDKVLVKLGDFGLATPVKQQESTAGQPSLQRGSSDKQEPSVGHLSKQRRSGLSAGLGTNIYLAPEQKTETSYDNKVDIYSLGVVLAELLCLFPTMHERSQLERLRKGELPDRLKNPSPKQESVVDAVRRMCRLKPVERPSAETLLESGLVMTKRTLMTKNQEMELMLSLLIQDKRLQLQQAKNMQPGCTPSSTPTPTSEL